MGQTQIRKITIVVSQGAKTYSVGDDLYGHTIDRMGVVSLHFQGDPFDHYVGYSKEGEMLILTT